MSCLNNTSKVTFPLVDFSKLLMALMVVAIHTRISSIIENTVGKSLIELLFSIAVPYFFVCSGYFVFRKDKVGKFFFVNLKRYIRMYIVWTIVYFPFTMYSFYADKLTFKQSILSFLRGFLFVGEHAYSWPLWYLLALIIGCMIVFILIKSELNISVIVLIAFIMNHIGKLLEYIHIHGIEFECIENIVNLYFHLFLNTRNGLFFGFLYIAIGAFIAKGGQIKSLRVNVLLLFSAFFLTYLNVLIGFPLLIFSLFNITLYKCTQYPSFWSENFRKLSTLIYFTHMLLLAPVYILKFDIYPVVLYICCIVILIMIYIVVKQYKECSLYKYLFD